MVYPYNRILYNNKVLTHATTWMNIKNMMINERSWLQKDYKLYDLFYDMCRIGKSMEIQSRLLVA